MEDDERKNVVASGIGTLQWGNQWLQNFKGQYKTTTQSQYNYSINASS